MNKARRLSVIAAWINNNMPGYKAEITEGYCNTDRKIGRLRSPGKGRAGNEITIYKDGRQVHSHNSAETYRTNSEVEEWLEREPQKNTEQSA